jgi:serine protease inhibitor
MPLVAAPTVDFGFRLLERLEAGVVVSPMSVHRALATVREGASGEARAALDEVLGPEPPSPIAVDDPGIELAIAQALWVDRAYRLAPPFAARAAELGVECRTLDFADPGAPAAVNAWAAERTRGMIPEVIDGFDADERFALADAAYFDGAWTSPFDAELTELRPFHLPRGGTADAATMHRHGEFAYGEDERLQAVRLPYGESGELGFVAVIAREGLEPPRLDAAAWSALRGSMTSRDGTVALPRITAESRLELTGALKALGLGPAFANGGDFDGLLEGPGDKSLSRVLHRTRVDLDERGTRAAAVTVGTMRVVSYRPQEPFELRLDRPFLWAIEHRPTGTLLFLGIATDPTEEST